MQILGCSRINAKCSGSHTDRENDTDERQLLPSSHVEIRSGEKMLGNSCRAIVERLATMRVAFDGDSAEGIRGKSCS